MRTVNQLSDILIIPLLLLVVFAVAQIIKNRRIDEQPHYKYFTAGLMLKIMAGLLFAAIYTFHYGETDTHYYYWGTKCLSRLFSKDFNGFVRILLGDHTPEAASLFDSTTGWPTYWRDVNSFAVCRFNILFYWLGFGSFWGNTIVMNVFLFTGIWRFYNVVRTIFPGNDRNLAIATLFIPSVTFWGSGLLKDGWCLVATLFIFCAIYNLFIVRRFSLIHIASLIMWAYISISIRPYSFFTAVGASLIWICAQQIRNINNAILRTIGFPIIVAMFALSGVWAFSQFGSMSGNSRYESIDAIIETAIVVQNDLKQEYYGGNSFDIGEITPSLFGIISKAPKAIMAGFFRPYIWDVRNAFMLLSGIESLLLMIITIHIISRLGIKQIFSTIWRTPFLITSISFALVYAFFVGLTTANFGALVRYRMPVLMFFAIVLAVLWQQSNNEQETTQQE